MLWRSADLYGEEDFDLLSPGNIQNQYINGKIGIPHMANHPAVAKAGEMDPDVKAFLFWTRMPVVTVEDKGDNYLVVFNDQRFMISGIGDRFVVRATVPKDSLDEVKP